MPALPPDDPPSDDYASTARFLANPPPRQSTLSPEPDRRRSTSRNSAARNIFPHSINPTDRISFTTQWPSQGISSNRLLDRISSATSIVRDRAESFLSRFTPAQRVLLFLAGTLVSVLSLLFLIYSSRIFAALVPLVKSWRSSPVGWLVLWLMVFVVSFPPMIGYSTCFTLGGFVFGVWKGYLIIGTATVVGSTCAFVASRQVLRDFVERRTARDKRFKALSQTVEHDGLKLLVMIRLCPLPYSLSNGAISTIPTVTPGMFAAATALASPKLLIGIFIGSRLGDIAEGGDKMDVGAKVASYISIAVGVALGVGTGVVMWKRTEKRAQELEQQGRRASGGRRTGRDEEAGPGGDDDHDVGYTDEDDDGAVDREARGADGISLHTADDGEDAVYRDDFGDDDAAADAGSLDAVFQAGDGDDSDANGPL